MDINYHPDLKKSVLTIIGFILIILSAMFAGAYFARLPQKVEPHHFFENADIAETVTCREKIAENERNSVFQQSYKRTYKCNLSNQPNVKFDLKLNCNDARNGKICMFKIKSEENEK